MLPTTQSVSDVASSAPQDAAHTDFPFTLIDLIEAAEALASRFVIRTPAGASEFSPALVCSECMRGTVGDELLHAESCGVGTVVRLASEARAWMLRAVPAVAPEAFDQPEPVSRDASLDVDACGDKLFDPTLDRELVCTEVGDHDRHFDKVENLHWDRDEVLAGKFAGDAADLDGELAKVSRFEAPGYEGRRAR